MTKRFFLTVLIAVVFGATAAADVYADPALNGEWDSAEGDFRFNDGSWEGWTDGAPRVRGTYTAWDGAITIRADYVHGNTMNDFFLEFSSPIRLDLKWYSRSELREAMINYIVELSLAVAIAEGESLSELEIAMFTKMVIAMLEEQIGGDIDNMLNLIFLLAEGTYSISGNTLTLVLDIDFFGMGEEYTRR
jgi:hypothetical protein